MSINPLNDISKVYLEQVATQQLDEISADTALRASKEAGKQAGILSALGGGDPKAKAKAAKKRAQSERLYKKQAKKRIVKINPIGEEKDDSYLETDMKKRAKDNEKAREDMKKTKAYQYMAAAARKKFDEALDAVGKEDADVDNDGKKNTKSDKYLMKRRNAIGQAISTRKENFSNWREELFEIVEVADKDKNNEKISEKTVKNKIKINPNIGEAVENLGGTLLEMVEIDEVDYIVESVYDELLDEGYEEDDIEEAIEYALTEATVTYGHDTPSGQKKRGNLVAAVGRLARQKLSSKLRGAKKAAKQAVATGARKVAKGALGVARKMEGGDKTPSTAHTKSRTASTYRGAGAGQKERVSSGSYTPPSKKKAEKPSDPWKGSETVPQKPKPKPKAQTTRPSDPWRGSETVPPKAKAKPKAKPKAKTKTSRVSGGTSKAPAKKKKSSNLDNLLASIRNEEIQIDEKTLTKMEMKKREELVKSMKKNTSDFEKRYPGRGKDVMYATATKMAKRIAEQTATELLPSVETGIDKKKEVLDKQKFSNMKVLQQKQQMLQRQKLQMQKSGRLPLEAD
ncbi:MAG: hypothetical protein ACO25L_04335 [Candidatus Nanopelagicales bacterium]